MGLDLKLLPFEGSAAVPYSHSILSCSRDSAMFELLRSAAVAPVPGGFTSYLSRDDEYKEPHYGRTVETPYGDPLMATTARSLLAAVGGYVSELGQNRAVLAYLRELRPDTLVALYWH